jgi:hypothetical protein
MDTHKNARLTTKGREQMVRAVVDGGLSGDAGATSDATRWAQSPHRHSYHEISARPKNFIKRLLHLALFAGGRRRDDNLLLAQHIHHTRRIGHHIWP